MDIISLHEAARRRVGEGVSSEAAALSAARHIAARADAPSRRLPLDKAAALFEQDLRLANKADRTREGYAYELERYARWLAEQAIDWQHISRQELSAYARTRERLSFSSRASLMVTMRQFYAWAAGEGLVVVSPALHLKTPKRPEPVPKALTADHVRKLLAHLAAHRGDSLKAQRDEALICTGLYQGMRAAELAGARWGQLDLAEQIITIPISKMARGRTMKVHPDLVPILKPWREAQGLGGADDAPVFALGGEPIVANRVGKIARGYAKLLRIPLTAHTLRHSFATWSLRKSGDIYAVSKALGHKHLTQTEVYLKSDPADSAPAVDALPGRDAW